MTEEQLKELQEKLKSWNIANSVIVGVEGTEDKRTVSTYLLGMDNISGIAILELGKSNLISMNSK